MGQYSSIKCINESVLKEEVKKWMNDGSPWIAFIARFRYAVVDTTEDMTFDDIDAALEKEFEKASDIKVMLVYYRPESTKKRFKVRVFKDKDHGCLFSIFFDESDFGNMFDFTMDCIVNYPDLIG